MLPAIAWFPSCICAVSIKGKNSFKENFLLAKKRSRNNPFTDKPDTSFVVTANGKDRWTEGTWTFNNLIPHQQTGSKKEKDLCLTEDKLFYKLTKRPRSPEGTTKITKKTKPGVISNKVPIFLQITACSIIRADEGVLKPFLLTFEEFEGEDNLKNLKTFPLLF